MSEIKVKLPDYINAKDGSLLIKKKGIWVPTTFEELNKANDDKFKRINTLENNFLALANNSKHFVKYAKSHFFLVLNCLKIKVLFGELDNVPDTVWNLEKKVLNDEISVEDALKQNQELSDLFEKIFVQKDMIVFPQV